MSTTERQQIVDSANAKVREMLGYWSFAEGDNVVSADGATVWAFHDAPSELQALSEHGGDEDWLVLWPPGTAGVRDTWVSWHSRLGSGEEPSRYELPCGAVVLIGAH